MKVTFACPHRTRAPDAPTRDGIQHRIDFALSRFGPRIEQVTVRISNRDPGEDRDGSPVLCRLSVRIKQLGSFSIESINDDPVAAASWAVDRAAKRVQRILDRRRDEG
jgi:hypothetical protein